MILLTLWACTTPTESDSAEEAGLTPLDPHDIAAPSDDDDPYPERAEVLAGSEEGEYDWAVLRGWVKADFDTVWGAITDPDVGVNRRDVASWTVTDTSDDDAEVAYVVNEVVTEPITVDFDLTWWHAHAADPSAGSVTVWEKTGGTEFIMLIAGSVVATAHDGVVDFLVVHHLSTVDSGPDKAQLYVEDFYASVLAASHGEALPTYE